jgi:hypothetical protein
MQTLPQQNMTGGQGSTLRIAHVTSSGSEEWMTEEEAISSRIGNGGLARAGVGKALAYIP